MKSATYYVSTRKTTALVEISFGIVRETAPVWRVFLDQPFADLVAWLRRTQGEVTLIRLYVEEVEP